MISPAKINLGLDILFKRPDNYHEIKSIFIRMDWGDEIEFVPNSSHQFILESENKIKGNKRLLFDAVSETGDLSKNILAKTYKVLCDITGNKPGITARLMKQIPPGGGLGGGSSNAAALIRYFIKDQTRLLENEFLKTISRIGADIPFFLQNSHCLVGGIGEKLSPIKLHQGLGILAIPEESVNTSMLYGKLKKPLQKEGIREPWDKLDEKITDALEKGNWDFLSGQLKNDFEKIVFQDNPGLEDIKLKFLEFGAAYASMTGSGSCLYAICQDFRSRDFVLNKMKIRFPELNLILFEF